MECRKILMSRQSPEAKVGGGAAIGVFPPLEPDSSGTRGEASDRR